MTIRQRYRHLLLALIFSICALVPAFTAAADFSGKPITAVNVTGSTTMPESDILTAVNSKPGDAWSAEAVRQDMQAIYELGWFFDVVANFTEVPEGVKVTYSVMENPALQEVIVKGNTKVTEDKIRSLLQISTGKVLNTKTLNENARAIEDYYHEQGFILAKVSDVSMSPGGVLTLTINEGVLEGIVVKGNDKTKERVITREMRVKPGEAFNVKDARRSMQKVYNLGYFEDVNMKLNPGQEPNAVVLEASVVEQKTGTFAIGGGYSKSDGMIGIIELGDNNFKGTGDRVKIHWEFGGESSRSNRNYEFSYTRPWLDSKQTSLGFSLYDMTNQYNDYYEGGRKRSTYDKNRRGWDITLGRPQSDFINNYITLKHRTDTYVEWADHGIDYKAKPGEPGYDAGYNEKYLKDNFGTTNSIVLGRVLDSRDNVFNPTEGQRMSLTAEFAGKAFGGDFDFNKYTFEDRHYFKVGRAHVIAVRGTVGYADGDLPDSGKFTVGGADSLRGYEDDQFKGNKMLAVSTEYRFPLAKKVEGVVFSDMGRAWKEGESYNLSDLEISGGVGIRVSTPIGPIRIDYAQGSNGGKTHFSFGGQF